MENLEYYDYALVNQNNVVFNIIVVSNHDNDLLESIKVANNADKIISCADYGYATIGGTWTGEYFLDQEGNKIPPTPEPFDENYIYDYNWETNTWYPSIPRPKIIIPQ